MRGRDPREKSRRKEEGERETERKKIKTTAELSVEGKGCERGRKRDVASV